MQTKTLKEYLNDYPTEVSEEIELFDDFGKMAVVEDLVQLINHPEALDDDFPYLTEYGIRMLPKSFDWLIEQPPTVLRLILKWIVTEFI